MRDICARYRIPGAGINGLETLKKFGSSAATNLVPALITVPEARRRIFASAQLLPSGI